MHIATILHGWFFILLAIFALACFAGPILSAGGWLVGGCLVSRTGNPCLLSPCSPVLLRLDRLCRAATGSGRKGSRVRTTDRRHSHACRARPFCPTHAREGYGQNCLNSVRHFAAIAAKMTLLAAPYFAGVPPGPLRDEEYAGPNGRAALVILHSLTREEPLDPRRLRKQFGAPGSASLICFFRLRPKGAPFWKSPGSSQKYRAPTLAFFREPKTTKIKQLWDFKFKFYTSKSDIQSHPD